MKPKLEYCHEIFSMNIVCQKRNVDRIKFALHKFTENWDNIRATLQQELSFYSVSDKN